MMALLGKPVSIVNNTDGSATVHYENGLKQRLPKTDAAKLVIPTTTIKKDVRK